MPGEVPRSLPQAKRRLNSDSVYKTQSSQESSISFSEDAAGLSDSSDSVLSSISESMLPMATLEERDVNATSTMAPDTRPGNIVPYPGLSPASPQRHESGSYSLPRRSPNVTSASRPPNPDATALSIIRDLLTQDSLLKHERKKN
eukprot:g9354.t1